MKRIGRMVCCSMFTDEISSVHWHSSTLFSSHFSVSINAL